MKKGRHSSDLQSGRPVEARAAEDAGEAAAAQPNGAASTAAATPPKPAVKTAAHDLAGLRHDRAAIRRLFETGEYPYKTKIRYEDYEKHKAELQVELLKAQEWVKATGQKIVLLFEARDAAGTGGTLPRFLAHLSPPPTRLLALVRSEWGIENGLHYRRDVTYEEDGTRMTQKRMGRAMAIINNLVISLLNRQGVKNHAQARRMFDAAPNKAWTLISGL